MYKVTWDIETNGVLLADNITSAQEIIPPRPVFYEELDLLGFNKFWSYPNVEEPLLWAIGRRYYYKGEWVAETK
ncbi:MAG: phosphoadenosine phosphosulfate reductase family protein, partial [bacterium]